MLDRLVFIIFLLFSSLLHDALPCMEELLQRIDASEYGYTRFNGPASWSRKFEACSGFLQSPVYISSCEPIEMPQLIFHGHADYRSDGFRLHNTFQSAEVQFSGEPPLLWGGPLTGNFSLLQVHFHWGEEGDSIGTEHVIQGSKHSLEAHLVHKNTRYSSSQVAAQNKDGLVVVSILFEENKHDNTGLKELTSRLQAVKHGDSYALVGGSAMTWLHEILEDTDYFTYSGSLTTPPCTQSVTWIILKNIGYVGYRQMQWFRSLRGHEAPLRSNRRPVQPINNRRITCSVS